MFADTAEAVVAAVRRTKSRMRLKDEVRLSGNPDAIGESVKGVGLDARLVGRRFLSTREQGGQGQ